MRSSIYRKLALGGVLFLLVFVTSACVSSPSEDTVVEKKECTTVAIALAEAEKQDATPTQTFMLKKDKATAFAMLTGAPVVPDSVWLAVKKGEFEVLVILLDEQGCFSRVATVEFDKIQLVLAMLGIDLQHSKQT